jgi:hypothetical protein
MTDQLRRPGRHRFTYANVVATLALVLAMSGGALAATHYIITSTHQISPKVLRKLKSARGRAGSKGAPGKNGTDGTDGKDGTNGQGPIYAVYHNAGHGGGGSITATTTLTIPIAGDFSSVAKVVVQDAGISSDAQAECTLTGGDGSDTAYATLPALGDYATIPLEIVSHFPSGGGTVQLSCAGGGVTDGEEYTLAKIIATEATTITNTAVTN